MENLPLILKHISQSKRVAVVLPSQATVDGFSAAIALHQALPGAILFTDSALPELPFLPKPNVARGLSDSDQLAIKISNRNADPKELRYEKNDEGLTVFITPGSGQFTEQDVSVLPSSGNFDLVIILGAASFEQLGKIYTDNTKLFFSTPSINIDNNPANEFYGTINFVNTNASSLCELVMDVVEGLPNALEKEPVGTALLTGIISQTSSFRDPKTTPSALQKASRLVAAGARQQDIIQHLFKTKPLPLLQLWGRALARLTAQPEKQALTAIITASDLEKTKMSAESLPIVLRDVIEMVTGYSLVVFLAEQPGGEEAHLLLAGLPYENLPQIIGQIEGATPAAPQPIPLVGKYQYVAATVPGSLQEIQTKLSQLIEQRSSVV